MFRALVVVAGQKICDGGIVIPGIGFTMKDLLVVVVPHSFVTAKVIE
jgi:hypothetical protein